MARGQESRPDKHTAEAVRKRLDQADVDHVADLCVGIDEHGLEPGRLADHLPRLASDSVDEDAGCLANLGLVEGAALLGEQGLQALVAKPTVGTPPPNWRPYLDKLPSDPWRSPYQYANPGLKGEIDVYSFGADGVAGGEGNNADIGSWQ